MNQQRQQQRVPRPIGARRRAPRQVARLLPVGLALLLAVACTRPAEDDAPAPAERAEETPTTATAEQDEDQTGDPAEEALKAYEQYLGALTLALGGADPNDPLDEHATGLGLETAREQLRANEADGLIATGTLQPSIEASDVTVDGDEATLTDCILNDLAHVHADNPDEVAEPANGNRHPLTVTLTRDGDGDGDGDGGGWKVSETAGPELRGPVPEGESCAPPALQQELLDQYEAYWDALYAAGDPGSGQPADPDAAVLSETMVEPQLEFAREYLEELRAAGQVLRGRPDTAPQVLAVLDYDTYATTVDCVIDPEGEGVYDVSTGERIQGAGADNRTQYLTEMRLDGTVWKVGDFRIQEEAQCVRPGE
ncbi:MAG: hypothetical protein GEV12_21855 [Micromonosporaceae bacterium]|nr:hypothetical protein [Micromonosporaceae bacterium]